jgi:hypothetical protein
LSELTKALGVAKILAAEGGGWWVGFQKSERLLSENHFFTHFFENNKNIFYFLNT